MLFTASSSVPSYSHLRSTTLFFHSFFNYGTLLTADARTNANMHTAHTVTHAQTTVSTAIF